MAWVLVITLGMRSETRMEVLSGLGRSSMNLESRTRISRAAIVRDEEVVVSVNWKHELTRYDGLRTFRTSLTAMTPIALPNIIPNGGLPSEGLRSDPLTWRNYTNPVGRETITLFTSLRPFLGMDLVVLDCWCSYLDFATKPLKAPDGAFQSSKCLVGVIKAFVEESSGRNRSWVLLKILVADDKGMIYRIWVWNMRVCDPCGLMIRNSRLVTRRKLVSSESSVCVVCSKSRMIRVTVTSFIFNSHHYGLFAWSFTLEKASTSTGRRPKRLEARWAAYIFFHCSGGSFKFINILILTWFPYACP